MEINIEKVKTLFTDQLRYRAELPGFRREETKPVIRHVARFNEKSYISYSDLTTESAEAVIDREMNYFAGINQAFEWKVYSYDQPPDLKDLLLQKGFICEEKEALMVVDMDEHDDILYRQTSQNRKELTSQKEIMELMELEQAVWGGSYQQLGKRLWRDKQTYPESLFLFGIYEGKKLVSAAWMYLEPDSVFASLWGGTTLPEYRGKGYYTDLITLRAQRAYEKGYIYLTVDARPMSQPILEKAGFERLAYSWGCQSPSMERKENGKPLAGRQ